MMSVDAIREILLEIGVEDVQPDARLRADLDMDSAETVQLEVELRRRLGVEVKLLGEEDHTVAEVAALAER